MLDFVGTEDVNKPSLDLCSGGEIAVRLSLNLFWAVVSLASPRSIKLLFQFKFCSSSNSFDEFVKEFEEQNHIGAVDFLFKGYLIAVISKSIFI